jgi:pimeloyl-ACP methyl ester carboxylesterase
MTRVPTCTRRTLLAASGAALIAGRATAAPAFTSRRIVVGASGSGPDVLLIPGLAAGPGVWSGVVAAVPGYRYHRVHVRGFARLPPDANARGPVLDPLVAEIARYCAEAGLRRPAIVGHSMGGTLALMLGLARPALPAGLMVVDMLPDAAGLVGGTASGLGFLAQQLHGYFTGTPAGRRAFADIVRRSSPGGADSDPGLIANALAELAARDLSPRLGAIRAPLRVVPAVPADARLRADILARFRAGYALAPTARIDPLGPSGHMVMIDQPARFAAQLRAFLAEVARAH